MTERAGARDGSHPRGGAPEGAGAGDGARTLGLRVVQIGAGRGAEDEGQAGPAGGGTEAAPGGAQGRTRQPMTRSLTTGLRPWWGTRSPLNAVSTRLPERSALCERVELHQPQHLGHARFRRIGRHAPYLQPERDIARDGQMRKQRVALEHDAHLARCGGNAVMLTPSSRMSPADGGTNPAIMRNVVVLPQPDGPSSEINSPRCTPSVTASTALCGCRTAC